MAMESVRAFFAQFQMESRIRTFDTSSATVELAAQALGCAPARIAKSLTFRGADGGVIMIVAAGDARIDNAAYKHRFGVKASMLRPDDVAAEVGHAVGGVCPFAVRGGVQVYLDKSLKRFDSVFPACGSGNSAIELSIPELEKYSGSLGWVEVCKGWRDAT